MNPHETVKSRGVRRLARVLAGLAGLSVCAVVLADRAAIALRQRDIRSVDPRARAAALSVVADEHEGRALEVVLAALARESDREALERAGYAAMRLGDRRGLPLLRQRADQGPDDCTRARLVIYAARLSGQDPRLMPWLEAGERSSERWRRLGSVIGLLELGRTAAGAALIEWLPGLGPDERELALGEFRKRVGEPMAQAVGMLLDWDGLAGAPAEDPCWTRLREFWRATASARLLNDILTPRDQQDPGWQFISRLLHGREYAERLLP